MHPSNMTDEELLKYAQMFLDRKEALPLEWQEILLKRFAACLDDLE